MSNRWNGTKAICSPVRENYSGHNGMGFGIRSETFER